MFREMLEQVHAKHPLIHNITNYVTVNDCANILLSCDASPIMADDPEEVEEITALCDGLNINIGTLNQRTVPSMLRAGHKAQSLGHPIVLDPVGAGASSLRTQTALRLTEELRLTAIRGNISEIKALALGYGHAKGVDANRYDAVTEETLTQVLDLARDLAARTGAVIAITGAIDLVVDTAHAYRIDNGHPMMSRITGTGCQLSALTAAFLSANPDTPLQAVAAALVLMGVCGEVAHERLGPQDGNATYRTYILDAVYHMDGDTLERRARYQYF